MSISRLLTLILLLLSLRVSEAAILPFMSETIYWDEDVALQNGQTLLTHRTAKFGPDAWGRSGRGPQKNQSMSFKFNNTNIEWEIDDKSPIISAPIILDFFNGDPVIVLPVFDWAACNKYGFPRNGLIAFIYKKNIWSRIEVGKLPETFKVNLTQNTHDIHYWSEYKDRKIDYAAKLDLERNYGGAKQSTTIEQASKFYSDHDRSCAKIHPLPDLKIEVAKKINLEKELNAKFVQAKIDSVNSNLEQVTQAEFSKVKGVWMSPGYLASSCKEVVKKIQGLTLYGENGRQSLVGFQLLLSSDKKIPFQEKNTNGPILALPEVVTCNDSIIYVIRRASKDNLIINRFTYGGEVIDALRINIPNVSEKRKWGEVWGVTIMKDYLLMSLAEYSYTVSAPLGGTISHKETYRIDLPN